MPSSSEQNTSFIPKRGAVHRRKATPKRQVFVFSLVTYSILFASLLAAGGVYAYNQYLDNQLVQQAAELNRVSASFSTQQLLQVQEFDQMLIQANQRITRNTDMGVLLDTLDMAIGAPTQLESLEVELSGEIITLSTEMVTESFDGALFQRNLFAAAPNTFSAVNFDSVALEVSEEAENSTITTKQVTAEIELEIPVTSVVYRPNASPFAPSSNTQPAITNTPDETSTSTSTEAALSEDSGLTANEEVLPDVITETP